MDGGQKQIGDYLFEWKRKFDNFWYHYKIALIMGILVFAFIIFCIAQCAAKAQGDANVAYIGAREINAEHFENLQSAFAEMLGEDLNGDGKIYVDFTHFTYMTHIQMENARAAGGAVNMQALVTAQTQISLELASGNIVIYFMDREAYGELSRESGIFMPLEDSLGFIPENAHDAYSLRLGSLQSWEYFEGLNDFPASTVVAVRGMRVAEEGNREMRERYERNLKMFRRLAEFEYKQNDKTDETDETGG